ncbi:hypothetical protein ACVWW1_004415 [Bradyrhizobium sp. JR3.5]
MSRKSKCWHVTIAAFSLMLIMGPTSASTRRYSHGTSGMMQGPSEHVDAVPSYDDPSRRGGQPAYSDSARPLPEVHVQPHGPSFDPNSASAMAVHRRAIDLDEMLKLQDQELDRRLVICRHC